MKAARFLSLATCRSGAAAAEMALVAPLLIVLMFGAFETGNYFLDNHVVAKAVRDGARYASRRSFTEYAGCTAPSTDVVTKTRDITRTGMVSSGGPARLGYWTDPTSITVAVACNTSGTYTGIYTGNADGAPVVTVSATVRYRTLFARFGLISSATFNINARSQAAVAGI